MEHRGLCVKSGWQNGSERSKDCMHLHAVDVMFVLFSAIASGLCHLLESYFLKWRVHFSLKSLTVEVRCLEGGGTAPSSVSHGKLGAASLTTWVEEGLAIYTNERWLNYELYLLPWVPILLHDSKECLLHQDVDAMAKSDDGMLRTPPARAVWYSESVCPSKWRTALLSPSSLLFSTLQALTSPSVSAASGTKVSESVFRLQ